MLRKPRPTLLACLMMRLKPSVGVVDVLGQRDGDRRPPGIDDRGERVCFGQSDSMAAWYEVNRRCRITLGLLAMSSIRKGSLTAHAAWDLLVGSPAAKVRANSAQLPHGRAHNREPIRPRTNSGAFLPAPASEKRVSQRNSDDQTDRDQNQEFELQALPGEPRG
jgi:hypothetical protein